MDSLQNWALSIVTWREWDRGEEEESHQDRFPKVDFLLAWDTLFQSIPFFLPKM